MPPKAAVATSVPPSSARTAAHPYAPTSRTSRRTTSIDEKPLASPIESFAPTIMEQQDQSPTQAASTRTRKRGGGAVQTPKSTRQQFSACHACRYRRVKCDLKDLSTDAAMGQDISCTNCLERGIRCKDDYADNKKQLRRGKRINQLELEDNLVDNPDGIPIYHSPIRPKTMIPTLKPEFFDSPFFRRFYIQRPIIDPVEFRGRYIGWLQHHQTPNSNASLSSATAPLSGEGQLLAKVLVAWAAAYGVDESGVEDPHNSHVDVQKRRIRVKSMIEEIITVIDSLGILRKPSWDGVRVLLMTLPLTEDVMDNPMDRLAMYESAVQQVYTLCQHDGVATGLSVEARHASALVRARIFWYAHVHEGLTTGLRGGRLLMDEDDLQAFHREMPRAPSVLSGDNRALTLSNMTYSMAFQYATAPIRLSSACRLVHSALTGPKARASRRLDSQKLEAAWEALAICWEDFESLRPIQRTDYVTSEDTNRFVDGWQIFLFECYNVIQEKIRDRLDAARAARISNLDEDPDSPATLNALAEDLNKYLQIAESKCFDVLDHVVKLIRRHLGTSFFAYDASLVRDGCFFAGHTLALMPGRDEDVKACLQALSEMRWAFSKGSERSQTVHLAWKSRADQEGRYGRQTSERAVDRESGGRPSGDWSAGETGYSSSHIPRSEPSTPLAAFPPPTNRQRPLANAPVSSLPTHAAVHTRVPSFSHQPTAQTAEFFGAHPSYFSQISSPTRASPPERLSLGRVSIENPLRSANGISEEAMRSPDYYQRRWSPTSGPIASSSAPAPTPYSSSSDSSSPPELAQVGQLSPQYHHPHAKTPPAHREYAGQQSSPGGQHMSSAVPSQTFISNVSLSTTNNMRLPTSNHNMGHNRMSSDTSLASLAQYSQPHPEARPPTHANPHQFVSTPHNLTPDAAHYMNDYFTMPAVDYVLPGAVHHQDTYMPYQDQEHFYPGRGYEALSGNP